MSDSNVPDTGDGRVRIVAIDEEFAAWDALPQAMRDFLRELPLTYSAIDVTAFRNKCHSYGMSDRDVRRGIADMVRKHLAMSPMVDGEERPEVRIELDEIPAGAFSLYG